jgi:hypothetical protein
MMRLWSSAAPILLAVAAALSLTAAPKRLLYLTHRAGFRHESVPRSAEVVKALAQKSGAFAVSVSDDCQDISRESLKRYRAVMFFTTGELPLDDRQKEALLEFVRRGGGFLGVHSATDTLYKWPAYGELIGAYFRRHPWNQEVTVRVEAPASPLVQPWAPAFRIHDEIYAWRASPRPASRVLLSLDLTSVDPARDRDAPTGADYPLAWTRSYGKGRVYYNALGHRPEVWDDPRFQEMLRRAILWAMK